jgi:uncharacterized protein involved in type VI secretion and phage assembly
MNDVFAHLLSPAPATARFYGLCVGVVTNNKDPDGLGRVKVRFPWLSAQDESAWARVATPMAGPNRGFYCLPEVDDEVLVGFEQGVMEHPYVVGALWNGKDKPPAKNEDGKNNVRAFTSRSGHTIRLDDGDGAEKIEIVDKSGKNKVVIDTAQNAITIAANADVTVQAGSGKVAVTGAEISVKAKGKMSLEAGGQMVIKGATVNIN